MLSKNTPFSVGVYRANEDMITYANDEINNLVYDIDESLKSDDFPDYTPEIMDLGLPIG
ncbi:MAG: hypothetical protein CM15mV46_680 [Caudoviricetes sp.]|nr:MAG: hypothetical protein CM15mV46_680 [Caudoviricetes sp.]